MANMPVGEPLPSITPNVVVQNPAVRKVANIILGVAGLALPIAAMIDAGAEAIDFGAWLPIASQINLFLLGVFNISVVNPNIPTYKVDRRTAARVAAKPFEGDDGHPRPHV
jgi:hypothetical protein